VSFKLVLQVTVSYGGKFRKVFKGDEEIIVSSALHFAICRGNDTASPAQPHNRPQRQPASQASTSKQSNHSTISSLFL
jgi:hypothetical protein